MQNIFLIVICKLTVMYMVLASGNVHATVDITEKIRNNTIYCSNIDETVMENTANVNFYTTETVKLPLREDYLVNNKQVNLYRAGYTDLSAIFQEWRQKIVAQNASSSLKENYIRISENDLNLVNIEEAQYKSKSVPMRDHEVSYHYPFTDYTQPRFCVDFSPLSTYSKPHRRLARNLKSIAVNYETNFGHERRKSATARKSSNTFPRGKHRRPNRSSSVEENFSSPDRWNKTFLLPKLLQVSHVVRNTNETKLPLASQTLKLRRILRSNPIPKKRTSFVKKRRKRRVRHRRARNARIKRDDDKKVTAYIDTLRLLDATTTPPVDSVSSEDPKKRTTHGPAMLIWAPDTSTPSVIQQTTEYGSKPLEESSSRRKTHATPKGAVETLLTTKTSRARILTVRITMPPTISEVDTDTESTTATTTPLPTKISKTSMATTVAATSTSVASTAATVEATTSSLETISETTSELVSITTRTSMQPPIQTTMETVTEETTTVTTPLPVTTGEGSMTSIATRTQSTVTTSVLLTTNETGTTVEMITGESTITTSYAGTAKETTTVSVATSIGTTMSPTTERTTETIVATTDTVEKTVATTTSGLVSTTETSVVTIASEGLTSTELTTIATEIPTETTSVSVPSTMSTTVLVTESITPTTELSTVSTTTKSTTELKMATVKTTTESATPVEEGLSTVSFTTTTEPYMLPTTTIRSTSPVSTTVSKITTLPPKTKTARPIETSELTTPFETTLKVTKHVTATKTKEQEYDEETDAATTPVAKTTQKATSTTLNATKTIVVAKTTKRPSHTTNITTTGKTPTSAESTTSQIPTAATESTITESTAATTGSSSTQTSSNTTESVSTERASSTMESTTGTSTSVTKSIPATTTAEVTATGLTTIESTAIQTPSATTESLFSTTKITVPESTPRTTEIIVLESTERTTEIIVLGSTVGTTESTAIEGPSPITETSSTETPSTSTEGTTIESTTAESTSSRISSTGSKGTTIESTSAESTGSRISSTGSEGTTIESTSAESTGSRISSTGSEGTTIERTESTTESTTVESTSTQSPPTTIESTITESSSPIGQGTITETPYQSTENVTTVTATLITESSTMRTSLSEAVESTVGGTTEIPSVTTEWPATTTESTTITGIIPINITSEVTEVTTSSEEKLISAVTEVTITTTEVSPKEGETTSETGFATPIETAFTTLSVSVEYSDTTETVTVEEMTVSTTIAIDATTESIIAATETTLPTIVATEATESTLPTIATLSVTTETTLYTTSPPPEITMATFATKESLGTTEETVTSSTEEVYETETMHHDEYGTEESYDEDEEESTDILAPQWQDYDEENITTQSITETTEKEIIKIEVTIVTEETNVTTPSVTLPHIVSTEENETITLATESMETEATLEDHFTFTTIVYTLPSTAELTPEFLPVDYSEESENVSKFEDTATTSVTDASLQHEFTTFHLKVTTDQEQKDIRHEGLREELRKKLKELEGTEQELLEREKQLQKEEENWELEKSKLMQEMIRRNKQKKGTSCGTVSSSGIPLSGHGTTSSFTSPARATTPATTTKDMLEQEIRELEETLSQKEKKITEKKNNLLERERRLQRDKEEFKKKMEGMEERLEKGEDIEEALRAPATSFEGTTRTTPAFSEQPPTDRTTFEIRESTLAQVKGTTTLRRIITDEPGEEGHDGGCATKVCLDILKKKPPEHISADLVTERVCLPFIPGKFRNKGKDKEKRTKVDELRLKEHEWNEGPFEKDRETQQTGTINNENDEKRSLSEWNRFKRGIPVGEKVYPGLRVKNVEATGEKAVRQHGNHHYRCIDNCMTTRTMEVSENDYRGRYNRKYKVRDILHISGDDEEIRFDGRGEGNDGQYDFLDQIEEDLIEGENTFPGATTNSLNNEMGPISEDEAYPVSVNMGDDVLEEQGRGNLSLSEDDEGDEKKKTRVRTRQTPGPEWPTEALTAFHVGGTRTWTIEYPGQGSSEDEVNFMEDLENMEKQPLDSTECYHVIPNIGEESLETAEGEYNKENRFESPSANYFAKTRVERARNR